MTPQTLPLSVITRISPLNPRHDDSDVSQLAATIRACGLIDPLVVWPTPGADGQYEVLSGGRRWRALREIENVHYLDHDFLNIPVEIHEGDEASARRVALAAAVTPRQHHPVDEFEAFSALEQAGATLEAIARDFGLSERHVRQRLALGRLAPVLRDMWRKGEIGREAAEAWASGPIEAQEALVESWRGTAQYGWRVGVPLQIRQALRGDALAPEAPIAKFLLRDADRMRAYVEAGGRVEEDLFSDAVTLRDASIGKRIADELLRAEAQRVADAEGWGKVLIQGDGDDPDSFIEPVYTPEQEARLEAIDEALAKAEGADKDALVEERERIWDAGEIAAFSADERARLGVRAELDASGAIVMTRAVPIAAEEEEAQSETAQADPPPETEGDASASAPPAPKEPPTPDPFAEPDKRLRPVIDEAVNKALRAITRRRVDMALMLAVAAMAHFNPRGVALRSAGIADEEDHELLLQIADAGDFAEALAICARAPTNDLSVAYARLVAASVIVDGVSPRGIDALCAAFAMRGADIKGALGEALDGRAFYEAAPKTQTLDIVAALIGPAEAKRVKKMDALSLSAYVDQLARDKGFLPVPLSMFAAHAAPPGAGEDAIDLEAQTPLAQAMAEAIEKDQAEAADKPAKKARKPRAAKTVKEEA